MTIALPADRAIYSEVPGPFVGTGFYLRFVTFSVAAITSAHIRCAIYTGATTPTTVVAARDAGLITTTGDHVVDFHNDVLIAPGSRLWYALDQDAAVTYNTTGNQAYTSTTAYAAFPAASPALTGPLSSSEVQAGIAIGGPEVVEPPADFPLVGVHKVLLPSAELQFADADGRPYAGGTLDTYVVDTTTPKTTWADAAGDVENTNPIVLNSAGRCIIYGNGGYRTVLKDSNGNLVWDQPSYTYVSVAMLPVVGAATLEDAREAMGINDAIDAEAAARVAGDAANAGAIADETARATGIENGLQAQLLAETARAEAAEAALQDNIDALASAGVSNVQGSYGQVGLDGHVRITFPMAYATLLSVVVTYKGIGFGSNTLVVGNEDASGFDVWITQAGTPIPKPREIFYWIALGIS